MSAAGGRFGELEAALRRVRIDEIELYQKEGQSRRVELGPQGLIEVHSQEVGWAVRAGGRKGSFFACGTAHPEPRGPWPAAVGEPLRLPSAREAEPDESDWESQSEPPLLVETEAIRRLETFQHELSLQLSGAHLVRAVLDDGASEMKLASSRGVDCGHRNRAAVLYLEVAVGGSRPVRRADQFAARSAAGIDFAALARRLGVLLTVARDGAVVEGGGGEMVLAPPAAARLLAGLLPLLVGPEAWKRARALSDRRGRIGSERLTVIDDGRLAGGIFSAPVDGEGVPTKAVTLIGDGLYLQPLLSWREVDPGTVKASGCSLRPSWRQPPESGPAHLFIAADAGTAPAALIGSVAHGYYWLDALGPAGFDLARDRFTLPVCGFRLRQGRASEPVASALLTGAVSGLLRGVSGVGRDLAFQPMGHLIGAPTLLVEGLELDGRTQPG